MADHRPYVVACHDLSDDPRNDLRLALGCTCLAPGLYLALGHKGVSTLAELNELAHEHITEAEQAASPPPCQRPGHKHPTT